MNHSVTHKKFIFSEKIDSEFLFSLYETDYPYILEVFTNTIEEVGSLVTDLGNAYHSGSPAGLRQAAHKMKPLFGFTGMLSVQEAVGQFEDRSSQVTWLEVLEAPYQSLTVLISEARDTLISEQKRLQEFIGA